jgi:hypothetical protein
MIHPPELLRVCRNDKEQGEMVSNMSITDIDKSMRERLMQTPRAKIKFIYRI